MSETSTDAIIVDVGSGLVTWSPPRDVGEVIFGYEIRIRQNWANVTTITVPGNSTSFDYATLSLQPGIYQLEVNISLDVCESTCTVYV